MRERNSLSGIECSIDQSMHEKPFPEANSASLSASWSNMLHMAI